MKHTTKKSQFVHRVTVSTRLKPTTSAQKRQADEQKASNVGSTYANYLFYKKDKGLESSVPGDESSQRFADTLEAGVNNDEWSQTVSNTAILSSGVQTS